MSFVNSSYTVGEVLAPVATGVLISGFGIPAMLAVRAALAIVTEVQAVRIVRTGPSAIATTGAAQVGDAERFGASLE